MRKWGKEKRVTKRKKKEDYEEKGVRKEKEINNIKSIKLIY